MNHAKSPRQHKNQSYAWCHGVLSVRSPNLCLLSSHVGVYLSVLQQNKTLIKWKITMSIRHAIGARWRPTTRGDVLQCPNARLKHAADDVAFELPPKLRHGEARPCETSFQFAFSRDLILEIRAHNRPLSEHDRTHLGKNNAPTDPNVRCCSAICTTVSKRMMDHVP